MGQSLLAGVNWNSLRKISTGNGPFYFSSFSIWKKPKNPLQIFCSLVMICTAFVQRKGSYLCMISAPLGDRVFEFQYLWDVGLNLSSDGAFFRNEPNLYEPSGSDA